jgi:hypothetical protein
MCAMVNPSTADAETDDPTIRKVKGFSERAGYGHIIVGNLFAFRATDIKQLRTARDPNGPDNDWHIEQIMRTLMLVARPNSDSWPARRWRKSGLAPESRWRTLWLTSLANRLGPI